MYSGATHLTVREAFQPRAMHRIQASSILTSGTVITPVYDTRPFTNAFLLTDISQVSGASCTLNIQMQTSPDNVRWFPVCNAAQRTSAALYYEKVSGFISEFTRFQLDVASSGGIWTEVTANFLR